MEVSVAEQGPVIRGDGDRLQQVLWNLLTNAIKFTPTGGKVQVSLEVRDDESRIIVEDTGAGIESEFLPYVFDRFRQAETLTTRKAGLGVGLAIVRYLVQAHGGIVTAESEGAGRGAKFVVTLPMLQSSD
jgi:signal transduction histidine kinase